MTAAGGSWPTPHQELLLTAGLAAPTAAVEAWSQWSALATPAVLDVPTARLLPLVYANLKGLELDPPDQRRLRTSYMQSWTRNQYLFRAAGRALGNLHSAGISALLLKGVPLAKLYYHDDGARPMWDCDVLVPTSQASRAFDVLHQSGWNQGPLLSDRVIATEPGIAMRNESGQSLDLHWHVLHDHVFEDADARFWRDAEAFEFAGLQVLTLAPEHHLLQVIAHGYVWSPEIVSHWISDVVHIIRNAPSMDWERLAHAFEAFDLPIALQDALSYVDRQGYEPIPAAALHRIMGIKPSLSQRTEHYVRLHATPSHVWGTLPRTWVRYRRWSRRSGRRPSLRGFVGHLQQRWDTRTWRGLLKGLWSKLQAQLNRIVNR